MRFSADADAWFPYRVPRPEARLRLFCFPCAGQGASAFRGWQAALPTSIDVWAAQLPGRETRFAEPPFQRLDPLVKALTPRLLPHLDRPFALFGHSMGALVAFEVARRLRREHGLSPTRLTVSACAAPHLPRAVPPAHNLPDAEFRRALRRYGGTPEAVLADEELMRLLSPLVRADLAVCETYDCAAEAPLEVPISVYGGLDDDTVWWDDLQAWREQTCGPFAIRLLPGGHFYHQNGPGRDLLPRLLGDDLAAEPGREAYGLGDEVHLWRVRLTSPDDVLGALAATLSPDERERAARLVRPRDRERFIVSHAALRSVLACYYGDPPAQYRFGRGSHGKPFLMPPAGRPAVEFNLSHSGDLALVAVTRGRAVGVDVEQARPDLDFKSMGRMVFSATERVLLESSPDEEQRTTFFEMWTRKEAYLKAIGRGFSQDPAAVTLTPAPRPAAAVLNEGLGGDWFVASLRPAGRPGTPAPCAAAVVVADGCPYLHCADWPP